MKGPRVCFFFLFMTMAAYIALVSHPTSQVAAGQPEKPAAQNPKTGLSKANEVSLPQPKAGVQPQRSKLLRAEPAR